MGDNVKAFIIALGLVLLFLTGALAGYSTGHSEFWSVTGDSAWRLQWEVLLTGLAAIAGGYMAYRGARGPYDETKRTKALIFKSQTMTFANNFIHWTNEENGGNWQFIAGFAKTGNDAMKTTVEHIFGNDPFPEVPEILVSENLLEQRQRAVRALQYAKSEFIRQCGNPLSNPSCPTRARDAIYTYITEIEKHL